MKRLEQSIGQDVGLTQQFHESSDGDTSTHMDYLTKTSLYIYMDQVTEMISTSRHGSREERRLSMPCELNTHSKTPNALTSKTSSLFLVKSCLFLLLQQPIC